MQGAVFGGLLDAPIKPTAKRKYQVGFSGLYSNPLDYSHIISFIPVFQPLSFFCHSIVYTLHYS